MPLKKPSLVRYGLPVLIAIPVLLLLLLFGRATQRTLNVPVPAPFAQAPDTASLPPPPEVTVRAPVPVVPVNPRTDTQGTRIHGIVRDAAGPVNDALVRLTIAPGTAGCEDAAPAEMAREVASDTQGYFAFEELPFDDYVLTALSDSRGALAATTITEDLPEAEVLLALESSSEIAGVVINTAGEPVPGARLVPVAYEMLPHSGTLAAHSDADGAFALQPLSAGRWKLAACAPGYAPVVTEWLAAPGPAVEIVLGLPQVLHGTVQLEGAGTPLAGVEVLVRTATRPEVRRTAITSEDGAFRFEDSAEQTLVLSLADDHYALIAPEGQVRVSPAQSPLVLEAAPATRISGRVSTSAGSPVAGATVVAMVAGRLQTSSETEDEGRYEILGIPAGEVQLAPRMFGRNLGDELAQKLTVQRGMEIDGIDFVLDPAYITGTVRYEDGSPAAGAAVQAVEGGGGLHAQHAGGAQTNGEGRFRLVLPGASANLMVTARTAGGTSAPVGPIAVAVGETVEVDIVLSIALDALLEAQVLTERSEPVRAQIHIEAQLGAEKLPYHSVRSDAQGYFSTLVPSAARLHFTVTPLAMGVSNVGTQSPTPAFIDFRAETFQAPLVLKIPRCPKARALRGWWWMRTVYPWPIRNWPCGRREIRRPGDALRTWTANSWSAPSAKATGPWPQACRAMSTPYLKAFPPGRRTWWSPSDQPEAPPLRA